MSPGEVLLAKDAKNGTSLQEHTVSVIQTALQILDQLPSAFREAEPFQGLREAVTIAALFHDSGKAHPEFQNLLYGRIDEWEHRRHEIISASFFALWYQTQHIIFHLPGLNQWSVPIWLSILLHHKAIIPNRINNTSKAFLQNNDVDRIPFTHANPKFLHRDFRVWAKNFPLLYDALEKIVKKMNVTYLQIDSIVPDVDLTTSLQPFLTNPDAAIQARVVHPETEELIPIEGLVREGQQHYLLNWMIRYKTAILLGLLKTSDHMASGGFTPPSVPLFANFSQGLNLFPFQEKVGSVLGSAILRAPTGAGKTGAAIAWAQTNQTQGGRFFYVLPFQASLNAMFKRFFSLFKDGTNPLVGICHSKNLEFLHSFFESDATVHLPPQALKSLAREVFFPIKLTTAHQLLRLILFGKGWETLLLELHNAVIIFDEIHAYEPRLLGLILGLMHVLQRYGVKILVMTATLPTFVTKLIPKYGITSLAHIPMLELNADQERDNAILSRKRHNICILDESLEDFLVKPASCDTVRHRYAQKSPQLFICNTVGTAQRLYTVLLESGYFDNEDLVLFHSHFTPRDRFAIEDRILSRDSSKLPLILVATQVVEVSLDINYSYGYFEACPIDALIQRMGRVNRTGDNPIDLSTTSNIAIFAHAIHDSTIYNPVLVKKTLDTISPFQRTPLSEMELVHYVDKVYPTFSPEDSREFECGLHNPAIQEYETMFEVGLQREWVVDLIENLDFHISVLTKENQVEFDRLWSERQYLDAKQILIDIDRRRFKPSDLIDYSKRRLNIHMLQSQDFTYDAEFGLQKKTRN